MRTRKKPSAKVRLTERDVEKGAGRSEDPGSDGVSFWTMGDIKGTKRT